MGLCKCPKHKVTNLFCFEHKVNVCEECMVTDHYTCMVRSYLQWLQDSDFTSICTLCGESLNNSPKGPCVRLLCLDVFHWSCLDAMMSLLPPNTAPAGYECPTCRQGIFPRHNQAGPVVEILQRFLSNSSSAWSCAGSESTSQSKPSQLFGAASIPIPRDNLLSQTDSPRIMKTTNLLETSRSQRSGFETSSSPRASPTPESAIFAHKSLVMEARRPNTASATSTSTPLLGHNARHQYRSSPYEQGHISLGSPRDYDDNKYARRPVFTWLSRWIKTYFPVSRTSSYSAQRRYWSMVALAVLAFLLFLYLMASVGRQVADNDPMLDPRNNPDIRVHRAVSMPVDNQNNQMDSVLKRGPKIPPAELQGFQHEKQPVLM